jgi:hypothetical protein
MSKEIKGLKDFRNQSNQFYDKKISEVKALGSKMNSLGPMQQLSKIT